MTINENLKAQQNEVGWFKMEKAENERYTAFSEERLSKRHLTR